VGGGDGAERDGGGAGFAEASGVGPDRLAEVALEEGEGKEAAVGLDFHLPREPAGRRRVGLRRHSSPSARVAAYCVWGEGVWAFAAS
jgi:hypothetical protein